MNEPDLLRLIAEKEEKIDDLKTKGGDASEQFIKAAAACLKSWYDEKVKEYITITNPAIINRNIPAKVDKLKKEIISFTGSFAKQISDSLDKGEKPWHRKTIDDLIEVLKHETNVAEGRLSVMKADAVNIDVFDQAFIQAVKTISERRFNIGPEQVIIVSSFQNVSWSRDMQRSKDNYGTIYQQVKPILSELKSLREQYKNQQNKKAGELALEKWNKAGGKD